MARLLIVDDDDAFRETLAETLEGLGHTVDQAASGDEALACMPRQRYDTVFLDHRMPGMDGLQTLAALQARVVRLPPVIVLTAYASGANTIEAMRLRPPGQAHRARCGDRGARPRAAAGGRAARR